MWLDCPRQLEENVSRSIKCNFFSKSKSARVWNRKSYRLTQVTKCCSPQSVVPKSHLKCSACVCCNIYDLTMRSPQHRRLYNYLPKLSISKVPMSVGPLYHSSCEKPLDLWEKAQEGLTLAYCQDVSKKGDTNVNYPCLRASGILRISMRPVLSRTVIEPLWNYICMTELI